MEEREAPKPANADEMTTGKNKENKMPWFWSLGSTIKYAMI